MAKKDYIQKEHHNSKKFFYRKGTVHLDFTLSVDVKQELKDFRDLLAEALVEVSQIIDSKK